MQQCDSAWDISGAERTKAAAIDASFVEMT
jgi:hypothetical protein